MNVLSYSEARAGLKGVLDEVQDTADVTLITRRKGGDAVVMSLDYFNGLMETVHLLRSPANAAHLAKSISQYRSGSFLENDLIDD